MMANPQKENGHMGLANEIAETFARLQLSGNQWRIMWTILRQTYGWNKKSDRISITHFQQRSGLKRRHICRCLNELAERKIVTKNDTTFITTYGLQKDYSKWEMSPKKTRAKIGDSTVTKNDTKTVTKNDTHKRHKDNKDTIPYFNSLRKRYPDQSLIDQVFKAIASTRKSNRVSESVLSAQLQKWEKYPVDQVQAGIRAYLEKDYASHGKKEEYLLGIIRNHNKNDLKSSETLSAPFHQPKEITPENAEDLYEN